MTRLSHLSTASLSRDSHPHNATAHQSVLSDMFTRQHTTSSRMRDYTISALHNSDFYPLDTPSRPSHSVVPHSMWTSSAAGQRRYDTPGVQGSRNIPNYLVSLAFPSNEEIMNPPMYYFPDEDDALAGNNSIGQLGIEYDEAVVTEMIAERRKAVGPEGIKAAVTITNVSSCQPSRHSSPRIKMLKAQPQNLLTTSRIDRLEGSSCHSSPRSLASQTVSRQPTPNADHSGTVEISGFNKQNESSIPAATSKLLTSCFDTVPMDHAPKGKGPMTMLVMDKVADSNPYAEVDHSMDSVAALNELNAKANDKTKSIPKLKVEPTGISSKQYTAVAVDSITQKKSKESNGVFFEPAPPITQPRPSRVPPRRVVTEIPRAAHPCDDASAHGVSDLTDNFSLY
ncbi:hypothetical protein BGZ81_003764 [Podila clonocystis]|nr:hypothetical protein BGZ81_003764 [Podila clonocystis]